MSPDLFTSAATKSFLYADKYFQRETNCSKFKSDEEEDDELVKSFIIRRTVEIWKPVLSKFMSADDNSLVEIRPERFTSTRSNVARNSASSLCLLDTLGSSMFSSERLLLLYSCFLGWSRPLFGVPPVPCMPFICGGDWVVAGVWGNSEEARAVPEGGSSFAKGGAEAGPRPRTRCHTDSAADSVGVFDTEAGTAAGCRNVGFAVVAGVAVAAGVADAVAGVAAGNTAAEAAGGNSLISGSSSVGVTAKVSLRTSGTHWSGSLSWSTLQSGDWQNTLWDVQLLSEVVHTFVGQGVVVVLPRELGLDETLGGQGLQGLDDVQVSGVNVLVGWLVEVLLGNNNTLWSVSTMKSSAGHAVDQSFCGGIVYGAS